MKPTGVNLIFVKTLKFVHLSFVVCLLLYTNSKETPRRSFGDLYDLFCYLGTSQVRHHFRVEKVKIKNDKK